MFDRFTDRSRKIFLLASQAALGDNRQQIGTGDILLALLTEGNGLAAHVLRSFELNEEKICKSIRTLDAEEKGVVTTDNILLTTDAKLLCDAALTEAHALTHNYVGTEHLLLALAREETCLGAKTLVHLGIEPSRIRREVLDILGHNPSPPTQ